MNEFMQKSMIFSLVLASTNGITNSTTIVALANTQSEAQMLHHPIAQVPALETPTSGK